MFLKDSFLLPCGGPLITPPCRMVDEGDEEDTSTYPSHDTFSNAPKVQKYAHSAIHPKVPKKLTGLVSTAMKDFAMVKPGDKLLIGLSGGKDSLSLLHILKAVQKSVPFKFEIAAATVNPETPEYDPSPLIDYMKELNIPYHMLCKPLIEMAKKHLNPKKPSICSFCSRMKRGLLYSCMRENGYNVLVLGQHLDDLAESFLMSAFHNGALRTMKASYTVQQEDVRVCRPLIYVREKAMTKFAEEFELPIIADNCPACFAAPKERHRIKLLLAKEEFQYHDLFSNLLNAMRPLASVNHGRIEDDPFIDMTTSKEGKKRAKQVSEKVLAGRAKQGISNDNVEVMPHPADLAAQQGALERNPLHGGLKENNDNSSNSSSSLERIAAALDMGAESTENVGGQKIQNRPKNYTDTKFNPPDYSHLAGTNVNQNQNQTNNSNQTINNQTNVNQNNYCATSSSGSENIKNMLCVPGMQNRNTPL